MKNYTTPLISVLCLMFVIQACQSNSQQDSSDGGYCNDLDTMYKHNSVEIEDITRTFYRKGHILNDCFQMQQTLGDSSFAIIISQKAGALGATRVNESELKTLFKNMRTISSNFSKNLTFNVGESIYFGMLSSGLHENTVQLSAPTSGREYAHSMDIYPADIDSMEAAYLRYLKEK